MTAEEATRGVAVEKLENMKKWGLNTYKVSQVLQCWLKAFSHLVHDEQMTQKFKILVNTW